MVKLTMESPGIKREIEIEDDTHLDTINVFWNRLKGLKYEAFVRTILKLQNGEGAFQDKDCRYVGTLEGYKFSATRITTGEVVISFEARRVHRE